MRSLVILLLAVYSLQLSAQQHSSPLFVYHETSASSTSYHEFTAAPADHSDKCPKYKRMKIAGAVMVGIGAVGVAGGVAAVIVGYAGAQGEHFGNYNRSATVNPIVIGLACAGVGGVLMLAGIPVLAIGKHKYRNNCKGGSRSYISTSGTNLALNF